MSAPKEMNIHQRIHAVMEDISYVQKEDKRVSGQYTFVSHDAVSAAIHPLLVKHGITAIPRVVKYGEDRYEVMGKNNSPRKVMRTTVDMEIDFVNIDHPEDRVTVPVFGYGIDDSDKGPGKAMSYATKYAMLKTFVLETGDDVERITPRDIADQAMDAAARGDWPELCQLMSHESYMEAHRLMSNQHKSIIKELARKRDEYRDSINNSARGDDESGVIELWDELNKDEKRSVFHVLDKDAQDYLQKLRSAA